MLQHRNTQVHQTLSDSHNVILVCYRRNVERFLLNAQLALLEEAMSVHSGCCDTVLPGEKADWPGRGKRIPVIRSKHQENALPASTVHMTSSKDTGRDQWMHFHRNWWSTTGDWLLKCKHEPKLPNVMVKTECRWTAVQVMVHELCEHHPLLNPRPKGGSDSGQCTLVCVSELQHVAWFKHLLAFSIAEGANASKLGSSWLSNNQSISIFKDSMASYRELTNQGSRRMSLGGDCHIFHVFTETQVWCKPCMGRHMNILRAECIPGYCSSPMAFCQLGQPHTVSRFSPYGITGQTLMVSDVRPSCHGLSLCCAFLAEFLEALLDDASHDAVLVLELGLGLPLLPVQHLQEVAQLRLTERFPLHTTNNPYIRRNTPTGSSYLLGSEPFSDGQNFPVSVDNTSGISNPINLW